MAKPQSGNGIDQPNSPFTVDTADGEQVEMPSVTKLLNRKKLGLGPATPETRTTATTQCKPNNLPPISIYASGGKHPQIQKVRPRKARALSPKIAHWTQESLAAATDPFQKAVHYLIQKGARQALLLSPHHPVSGQAPTRFDALCAYMTEEKDELWSGLSLSTSMIPEIWNLLFTQGVYEIVPSLSLTTQNASAAFLIKAFGLKPTEFFVIIRCGSPNACTGLLALVSSESLSKEIAAAFSASKNVSQAA